MSAVHWPGVAMWFGGIVLVYVALVAFLGRLLSWKWHPDGGEDLGPSGEPDERISR